MAPAPAWMPFDLFAKQEEMLDFLDARLAASEDGLIEKSRDVGFNWVSGVWAFHKWRFAPGFKTTFGSYAQSKVDESGNPDSIFEKLRLMMQRLPPWYLPPGFEWYHHSNFMRLINPENGNTITGECGDNMGRGGRSTVYIVDEAAHVERAERVEASTSANADVRIWASSVQGMGNLFARKRWGGSLRPDQVFRFHWSDDPRKTVEWAAGKKASMDEHVWAAEYDIDYSASVEGICIPARWVEAAQWLHQKYIDGEITYEVPRTAYAGLDVGAGGKGKSVFGARAGALVSTPVAWSDPDTIETAHRALDCAAEIQILRTDGFECRVRGLYYDSPGVGAGVQAALKWATGGVKTHPINTGMPPTKTRWPDGETSDQKFLNLKAELWWIGRSRFKAAFEKRLFLEGHPKGIDHPIDDCILLPPSLDPDAAHLAAQVSLVKSERNEKGKICIETKASLRARGIASPDHADMLMLTFADSTTALSTWEKLGGG